MQTGDIRKSDLSKLLSAFDQLSDLKRNDGYNKLFTESSLSTTYGRRTLAFDRKSLSYWEDYFGRFENSPSISYKDYSKELCLNQYRSKNKAMTDKIIDNLVSVVKLRNGPNDLVFSEHFLIEHNKIILRLSGITGMDRTEIEKLVQAKVQDELKMKKQAEEETKGEEEISIIDSLLM